MTTSETKKSVAVEAAAIKAAAIKAAAAKAAAAKAAAPKAAAVEVTGIEATDIEAAAKECFVNETKITAALFITALQKRKIVVRKNLTRIIESTDYLQLTSNNTMVMLTRSTFSAKSAPPHPGPPPAKNATTSVPPSAAAPVLPPVTSSTKPVPPLTVNCDTMAIVDILANISVKINGECIEIEKAILQSDVSSILERLPGGGPDFSHTNRVIFGQTLHRLAAVTYDGSITGITIRIGRNVSGLLPVFEGIVEEKNVLLCGAPNVGKTTTLREICKYLSRRKCLCLIDTSGEVCGESGNRRHIVGTSRVFRPVDPAKQYATLLDCVRNHSPDIIAIDELNTKAEVDVCQTIALRSIQMVASVHGNIQDLVFNPMLNKALGGSTEVLLSDRVAVDGRKVVMQRSTRPIFDIVINITRTSDGLEYTFIEDVADNVSRIMQGKPIQVRRRRMVDEELLETREEVLYPCE
ncbi:hypothetical protein BGZ97_002908 [Linnemannia gamsii]|uniref:AAA+ ATPase domain-containing protein n=1 Tax=Linnemannia gamsii TaxID=64522 RepID=A0A9P6UI20_9FUNG|nr:hypothetical protein BGZ97_002908 [Linnemannia gamsii]